MADHLEPDLDDDYTSYFQRAVVLEDWWLIKCSKEFEGKRFGVAGIEGSVDTRAMRLFTSSPIIKAFNFFTIQASDGINITLNGLINKERVLESGFSPEICSEFVIGFPPRWEIICNNCFQGVPLDTDINIGSSVIDKASGTDTNMAEINKKDGHSGGSRPRDIKTARSKPPRLQSKSRGKTADAEAKSSDVGKDECEAIDNEVVSPTDGCVRKHTDEDNVDIVTSTVGESLTSEQEKIELEETRASSYSLLKDLDKSSKPGKKQTSKKSGNVLQSDGNEADAEPMNHSGTTKVKSAEIKRKIDVIKVQRSTTDDGDYGSKGLNKAKSNNSSKPSKKGKSKKSEKTLKSGCNVVEPMNHSGSKVEEAEEFLSLEKLKRKIDFDVEVTPEKKVEKQKSNAVSIGSSTGQKRSRSGRLLVSPLEFWRNQVLVYDKKRNLVEVREGNETDSTPSKGKRCNSPKPRR